MNGQKQEPTLPKVSPLCEKILQWREGRTPLHCDRPTAYWYPAWRAGTTMALCDLCAKPLLTTPAYGLQPYVPSQDATVPNG